MSGFDLPPETELAPAPLVQIGSQLSPAPWQYRFTGEDALELASYNAQTGVRIAVQGRMWNAEDGIRPFAFEHVPAADRTRRLERFGLPFGYLLNCVIFASAGAPKVGQTFVSLHVIRGAGGARYLLATLLQGYVTAEQELGFPGSAIVNSLEGGGFIRTINGTTPAIGIEFIETVPAGARWQLLSIFSIFNSSATNIQRRTVLFINSGGGTGGVYAQEGTVGPNDGKVQMWAPGLPAQAVAAGYDQMCPLPNELLLLPGDYFQSLTNQLQPADWYTAPRYTVREWLEAQGT